MTKAQSTEINMLKSYVEAMDLHSTLLYIMLYLTRILKISIKNFKGIQECLNKHRNK